MKRQSRHDDRYCICHEGKVGHHYQDDHGYWWHSATFESLNDNFLYALSYGGPDFAEAIVNFLKRKTKWRNQSVQ